MKKYGLLLGSLILATLWASNGIASDISPKEIVENLYKPYLKDLHAKSSENMPDALDMIFPRASTTLQKAISKNKACEQREQGVCNIDFDIIIKGQDWDLPGFHLRKDFRDKNRPIVYAEFLNGDPNRVSYFFICGQRQCKIDEIEAVHLKVDGSVDSRFKLKESLLKN